MRKSLVSALYGIAVARGQIDLQATLRSLRIDDSTALSPTELSGRVEDIISSRSGVYIPAAAETPSARAERPSRGQYKPGEHWYYNNWDFNLAGEIYQRATGRSVFTAFEHHIAEPLCMQDFDAFDSHYDYEPEFSRFPAYYFRISSRDLARFGHLFLDDGRWGGRQVVPADWVARSTSPISPTGMTGAKGAYGYMWWVTTNDDGPVPRGSFSASGWHGHRMTVIPQMRTIIVNRMNTDDPAAPYFADNEIYDRLLADIMKARLERPASKGAAR